MGLCHTKKLPNRLNTLNSEYTLKPSYANQNLIFKVQICNIKAKDLPIKNTKLNIQFGDKSI